MKGSIIVRKRKDGSVAYLPKFDSGRDPKTNKRLQSYGQTHSTKKAALQELRELMVSVDKGVHVASTKLTVAGWISSWLESLEAREAMGDMRARTREGYANWLRLHVVPTLGAVELQALTKDHINRLYVDLLKSGRVAKKKDGPVAGLSQQTVLHVHRALYTCLRAAVDDCMILRNPAERAVAPKPGRASKKVRCSGTTGEAAGAASKALNPDQQAKLIDAFREDPLYTLVVLGLFTGLRRGELLGLKWSAIDFDRQTLTVERTIERTRAYGIRLIEAAKNDSSVRTIGIDRATCDVLRRHRAEQRELALKLGVPYPIDCLLFAHPVKRQPAGLFKRDVDFNRPVDPEEVTKKFARGAVLAGFVGFTLHGLRHTHATQLLLDGVPVHVVAQRLGHSTPAITSEVYAHVIARAEERAVEVAANMARAALRL